MDIQQIYLKAFNNLDAIYYDHQKEEDFYSFIPCDVEGFLNVLVQTIDILGEDKTKKFLDVGCGIGTKMLLASSAFDVYGIEVRNKYIQVAKTLGMEQVFELNALDFCHYCDFDVIYFFTPIRNKELEKQLEIKIYTDAKDGAIIIPFGKKLNWDELPNVERSGDLYFKRHK